MKIGEIWKPVVGYEGLYEVSNRGRVRSLNRTITNSIGRQNRLTGKLLARRPSRKYLQCIISKGNVSRNVFVHTLVCVAFHGPRPNGQWIRHLDGDGTNNDADNLKWGTPKENMRDQYAHGTRIFAGNMKHSKLTPDAVRSIRERRHEPQAELASQFGVSQGMISNVIHRRAWAHVR